MKHCQLIDECVGYIKMIRVIEDWFVYMHAIKRVTDPDDMWVRLNTDRPMGMPSVTQVSSMNKEHLIQWAEKLSQWQWKLQNLVEDSLKKGWVPPKSKFAIYSVLCRLENGLLEEWIHPFTYDMRNLPSIFPKRHRAKRAKSTPDLCVSEPETAI